MYGREYHSDHHMHTDGGRGTGRSIRSAWACGPGCRGVRSGPMGYYLGHRPTGGAEEEEAGHERNRAILDGSRVLDLSNF